ncbi:uncharacterized protein [Rutidosis leptorrhynchoides]|uniref:uncharacterized protein n=1 Tax=Rutidosis leptorrhynchoides TaxID=125765 RepID=UPI003A9A09C3
MGGRNFTRVSDDGVKYSKLDRFLVNEKFYLMWSDLTALALERKNSDHCPIVLKDEERNFGAKPFIIFDTWLNEDDIEQVINDAWCLLITQNCRMDCCFRNKLKNMKHALKEWSNKKFNNIDAEIECAKAAALEIELKSETQTLNDEELLLWKNRRKNWLEKEKSKCDMLRQKARLKWILEGMRIQGSSILLSEERIIRTTLED